MKFSRETRVKRALTRFSCEIFHLNFTWSYFKWNSHEQFHVNFTSHEFHMNIGWNFTWNSREAQLAVYVLVVWNSYQYQLMDPMLGTVPRNKPRIQEVWPLWCNRRARNYIMFYKIYHPIVKVQVHQLYTSTSVYQQQN